LTRIVIFSMSDTVISPLLLTCVQLSPDEEERRRVRRERNKQAAAKCRQKRVDLTNQLLSVGKILEPISVFLFSYMFIDFCY